MTYYLIQIWAMNITGEVDEKIKMNLMKLNLISNFQA